jgi:hypothetical protein
MKKIIFITVILLGAPIPAVFAQNEALSADVDCDYCTSAFIKRQENKPKKEGYNTSLTGGGLDIANDPEYRECLEKCEKSQQNSQQIIDVAPLYRGQKTAVIPETSNTPRNWDGDIPVQQSPAPQQPQQQTNTHTSTYRHSVDMKKTMQPMSDEAWERKKAQEKEIRKRWKNYFEEQRKRDEQRVQERIDKWVVPSNRANEVFKSSMFAQIDYFQKEGYRLKNTHNAYWDKIDNSSQNVQVQGPTVMNSNLKSFRSYKKGSNSKEESLPIHFLSRYGEKIPYEQIYNKKEAKDIIDSDNFDGNLYVMKITAPNGKESSFRYFTNEDTANDECNRLRQEEMKKILKERLNTTDAYTGSTDFTNGEAYQDGEEYIKKNRSKLTEMTSYSIIPMTIVLPEPPKEFLAQESPNNIPPAVAQPQPTGTQIGTLKPYTPPSWSSTYEQPQSELEPEEAKTIVEQNNKTDYDY